MCVQYRGGRVLSIMGVTQDRGGYHEYLGGYLQYRMGCSVPWGDIMIHVWGHHEYRGCCIVPWRYSNNKRLFPPRYS